MKTSDEYRQAAVGFRNLRLRFQAERATSSSGADAHSYGVIVGICDYAADYAEEIAARLEDPEREKREPGMTNGPKRGTTAFTVAQLAHWVERAEQELDIAQKKGLKAWLDHVKSRRTR